MRTSSRFQTKKCRSFPSIRCLLLWLALSSWMIISQVAAEPRSLYIWGPLSTEYVAETAQFGDPLDRSITANLMLPPDDPWLCEYPASLENLTAAEIATQPQFYFDQNVALFVSINRCSAETKARVAAQLAARISDRIKLIILYSTNPTEFKFVSLKPDSAYNGNNKDNEDENQLEDLQDIGVLYIPHRYASGIDLRMRMQYQGDDPRFSWDTSERWNFPIEVTALSDNVRPQRSSDTSYTGGDIYWFRLILFSLLIASPCCRACYLWYAGGGRLHWRRNEQGHIVGIQYIPPMPLWLTTGRPPHDGPTPVGVLTEEEFNNLPEIVYTGVPQKDDDDNDDNDDDENDHTDKAEEEADKSADNQPASRNTESRSGAEEVIVDGLLSASDVDVESGIPKDGEFLSQPDGNANEKDENVVLESDGGFLKASPPQEGISIDNDGTERGPSLTAGSLAQMPEEEIVFNMESNTKESLSESSDNEQSDAPQSSDSASRTDSEEGQSETVGLLAAESIGKGVTSSNVAGSPDDVGHGTNTTNDEEAAESLEQAPKSTPGIMSQNEVSNETGVGATVTNDSGAQAAIESVDTETAENESGDPQTTSTACAICIDEFETGEKLTLLPRCKHAFHRECIHAWLIERQGCCPLCKTDVLEPDPNNSPGELDLEAPAEQRFMISST